MPALVLKSIPESLHRRLKAAAASHRRSLTQEAIILLDQGFEAVRQLAARHAVVSARLFGLKAANIIPPP